MLKLYVAAIFILLMNATIAQIPVFKWVKTFDTDNSWGLSNGRRVRTDSKGNVYSAGLFQYTVDFDPGAGVYPLSGGMEDNGIYISKLSPSGDFIWAKQVPSVIEFAYVEMQVDKDGNVYVTAYIITPTDMDPGPGTHIVNPIGGRDCFVMKLDTDGNLMWVKQFGGPGDTGATPSALEIDKSGDVIVCGAFNNTIDFDPGPNTFNLTSTGTDAFIVKLNSDGNFIWAKQLGNYNDIYSSNYITDVKYDLQGDVYTTGTFSGNCDFDPGAGAYRIQSGGPSDGYICKLDANGNFVWAQHIGNSANYYIQPHAIALDENNNVYTTGVFDGPQDFDPGTGVYTLPGNQGFTGYLLKLDVQGNFKWAKQLNYGNDGSGDGLDVVIDPENNVYADGDFYGTNDFDPGPGTFSLTCASDQTVLTKYNADGDFIFACVFGNNSGGSYGRRMSMDDSANIYMTGFFSGPVDFDPGPNVHMETSTSTYSPFVLKLSRCSNVTAATLNISACDSFVLNNKTFDTSGTYTQVIPNLSGCDSIITLNLIINKKFTQQTKTICEGETFFAGGAFQHIQGIYVDTLHTFFGCDSVVTTYLVVNPKPSPDLGADRNLCQNNKFTISPGSFTKYLWQDMSTLSSYTISTSGVFWVTVTNEFNCAATDSIIINAIVPNPSDFLQSSDSICSYDNLIIQPLKSYNRYQWSTGAFTPEITVNAPGQYILNVTDGEGCSGADSINIYSKNCYSAVYFPSAFTPNGDQLNDIFKAKVYGNISSFYLRLFNQWGQMVYSTTDYKQGWDGTIKNSPGDNGVYVWTCIYQLRGSGKVSQKGTVVLLR